MIWQLPPQMIVKNQTFQWDKYDKVETTLRKEVIVTIIWDNDDQNRKSIVNFKQQHYTYSVAV